MPATVSVTAFDRGPSTLTGNGITVQAHTFETIDQRHRETSITFGQRSVEAVLLLLEACNQAAEDDTIEPVAPESYNTAEAFLAALPPRLPLPEITVHPDGEIAFEWHLGKRRVLTVSCSSNGSLAFAGLFGADTVYGRELFSDAVPDAIAHCLARLFPVQTFSSAR
jgi:hypothetical protein